MKGMLRMGLVAVAALAAASAFITLCLPPTRRET